MLNKNVAKVATQLTKQIKSAKAKITLNLTTSWLLLLCQLFNLSLVGSELTFWMISLIILSLSWRALMIHSFNNILIKANRWLVALFAIGGCIAIAASAKQLGLLVAMLHLLSFAYALKTLELKTKKDFYQLILLGLFLLGTSLIFNQSLLFSGLVTVILIVNFTVLLQHYSPSETLKQNMLTSAKLLLQSLPLAIVLFIVFPRLAPFWQVPLAKSATTGLSDTVSPGDIANLARSTELAFRVTFDNEKPSYSTLYWRALVLDSFDGRSWQRSTFNKNQSRQILNNQILFKNNLSAADKLATAVSYQVIVQPSYQHWLFALDVAKINNKTQNYSSFVELPDYSLQSKDIVSQTLSYRVDSYLQAPLDLTLSNGSKQQNLSYPDNSNPRLLQEAKRLRGLYQDDLELAQAVLDNFSEKDFYYTLKPPLLFDDPLDQFYFDTQRGFCAHYASAFTYIMRAAGIPARMVTGYLGGEYNPNGNYYAIYQYEAHAWSEIWLAGIGWYRVDPTAAVDPERVERGLSSQLLLEQASLNNSFFDLSSYRNSAFIKAIRLKFSAIDYQWTRWVIGYSSQRQYDLLTQWFGQMKSWKTAAIIGSSFVVMMLLLLFLKQLNFRKVAKNHQQPWLDLYQQAVTLLSRYGVDKPIAMSVNDYAVIITKKIPAISQEFTQFTQCFIRLHYQKPSKHEQKNYLLKMKSALKRIKRQVKIN